MKPINYFRDCLNDDMRRFDGFVVDFECDRRRGCYAALVSSPDHEGITGHNAIIDRLTEPIRTLSEIKEKAAWWCYEHQPDYECQYTKMMGENDSNTEHS
jgi:hypothetical protein